MDRRQRKTRNAIFTAFISLLSEKNYNRITVGDIIERADIGRATFYAHFETKDFLLKELCDELFCHIFDCITGEGEKHSHIFTCYAPDSIFLHLFQHIQNNDNRLLSLLSCSNNELFLSYFKNGLINIVRNQGLATEKATKENLSEDFIINHIASTFVETTRWWIENKMSLSPEEITGYFLAVTNINQ